ncbi:hypothetical protein CVD25_10160 [Bacillus canaveralius]|uniref:DMT family transporter n=1 Tax=Bacillus canaveralius TaxID=1403243 RepID=A0A2N5GME6_9BACI|nr:DMT family transporter [Bacillus canaveralius]PLR83001.1 hypothetical protein CU635_11040 [Bacillus canaveralius]PLR96995.1 hypothetical protein CVD25_10160 [Bacillus canaveralius]
MNMIFPLLAFLGGIAIAFQDKINGGLGRKVGVFEGAFISFATGALALFLIIIFFGKGNLSAIATVPKWQLIGGLLGALYVSSMVLVVPKIGVATTIIAVIAGQIIVGVIIDHYGLLGGMQIPFNYKKLVAMIFLFASVYLFIR